ncbi:hypothetical protein [Bradyrhizobium genosp. A]|uniref:hypothetical protein n=1 Tax=Bradyrhizobium genosp. A TaxID=83626 RepID=UPI003CE813CC
MMLMPCFEIPNQANEEGRIIGLILVGYGELETTLLACLVGAEYQLDTPVRSLFKDTNAERRVKEAKRLLLPDYAKAGLEADLKEAISDLNWCRKTRNQYAHCQWGWTQLDGLFFVNLEQLATQPALITNLMANPLYLDLPLLQAQLEFCAYVRQCFMYLSEAYKSWDRAQSGAPRSTPIVSKPSKRTRPQRHNLRPR